MKPRPGASPQSKRNRAVEPAPAAVQLDEQLRRLIEVGIRLAELREIEPLLEYTIDQALELCTADRGGVFLVAADDAIRCTALRGLSLAEIDQTHLDQEMLKVAARAGQPVPLPEIPASDRPGATRSGWCIPLLSRSDLIGVIYIDRLSTQTESSSIEQLALFARLTSAALENAQAHQAATDASELLEERASLLEQRVADRGAELQKANSQLVQRAVQLETHSQVAQQITSLLDLDNLLTQVVQFIQASFNYYFVGVWLVAAHQEVVTLQAGTARTGGGVQGLQIPMSATSLVVGVCLSGKYRLVNDVTQASDYMPLAEVLPHTRAELVLPLHVGDHVLGALDIQSDQTSSFSYDDRVVLQILGDQIAVAIRNAQLYELEHDRRHLAEALERTGRELSSNLDLREVPRRVLDQLASVVPYERGSVLLQEGELLHIVAQRGFPSREGQPALQVPIRPEASDVYQQLVTTLRPVILDDVTREPSWQQQDWLPMNHSWLGVPLIINERVIGMLSLTRREMMAFSADDAVAVSAFAGQAAIALENAKLYAEIQRLNEELEQRVQTRTEELNKAYTTLEHLDKTKSDFIEVAAHELRTPLTVIKGYAQLLNVDPALAEESDLKLMVGGVLSGTVRMQEIVNNMLDVTKIDSEALHMHRGPTYASKVIRNVAIDFSTALHERQLTLTTGDLENLPTILADGEMLYKVFYHLINNSIKYTPDGGSIVISGHAIVENDQPLAVEVVISDTGIGIDPAHHELIFEKFYQTGQVSFHSSGRTKFKGGGPGLGLAIAKGIVLAHGGRIWVESPGYDEERLPGSQFHVLLPLSGGA
jgi:signal transduction histidine kinase